MPNSSSIVLSLLIVGLILSVTGAYSIWLGENGTVINNSTVHFGATTTAEINNGIIFLSVGIAAFAIFVVSLASPRIRGLHYTSQLTCPNCKKHFDYSWVPFISFSAVRLGSERYLRCPNCHKWSTFEIIATRIKQNQTTTTQEPNLQVK